MDDLEQYRTYRDEYKPRDKIKVLFIGESPPDQRGKNGKIGKLRFFYKPEFLWPDALYQAIAKAIYDIDVGSGQKEERDEEKERILRRLQADGYWLIDVVDYPINKLPERERSDLVKRECPKLVRRCFELAPEQGIIICKADVYKIIKQESAKEEFKSRNLNIRHKDGSLPFPSISYRSRYPKQYPNLAAEFIDGVCRALGISHPSPK